jgi:hypothetical protein
MLKRKSDERLQVLMKYSHCTLNSAAKIPERLKGKGKLDMNGKL